MHNLLPSARREVRLELGVGGSQIGAAASGEAGRDGSKCLAQSRRVDLMAARLQSSCRRRAPVAAGGGRRPEMGGAVGSAALRAKLMRRRRESPP